MIDGIADVDRPRRFAPGKSNLRKDEIRKGGAVRIELEAA
jgi:hypothetical protein